LEFSIRGDQEVGGGSFPERFPVFTGELPPKELQSLWSIFAIIAAVNSKSFQTILEVTLGFREIGTSDGSF
jgi:hypothetical protein